MKKFNEEWSISERQQALLSKLASLYRALADECMEDDEFNDYLADNNDLIPRSLDEMAAEWEAIAKGDR